MAKKPHLGPIMASEKAPAFKPVEYANTPQLRDINFLAYTKYYRQYRGLGSVELNMAEKAMKDVKQGFEAATYEQLLTGVR